jgi:hypothetical protein
VSRPTFHSSAEPEPICCPVSLFPVSVSELSFDPERLHANVVVASEKVKK